MNDKNKTKPQKPKTKPALTSTSSLTEVFNQNIPIMTAGDEISQKVSPLLTAVASLTGSVSLVGFNLEQFKLDC